ncbi:cytochrome P450 [Kitasatospora paranensis]
MHRAVAPDGAPVRLVTGYAEVRAAAADPRLSLDKRHAASRGGSGDSLPPELDAHLLNSDPPRHTRLRALVNGAFGPRQVRALRARVQRSTDRLLDGLDGHRSADVVADLATPLSMTVICELLGVPAADRPDFAAWTDTLLCPAADAPARSREAMRGMHAYLTALVARRRAAPDDDLLSGLIGALPEDELIAMAFLLLFAGYHNTIGLIATTVLALLSHPDELAALRAGRLTLPQVTEEVLRWNPPALLAVRRFPREEVEIGGTTIGPGERVWLSWASANRDEAVFPDPDAFRPGRPRPHLAFGHGPHHCPGAALARLENEVAVGTLLRRFPGIDLLPDPGGPHWRTSLRSRALVRLPVTL